MENFTAGRTAARAQFHQVIGLGEQVEVVFDHDDGVALVDQAVQHADELLAVAQVQADGRLLEEIEVVRLDAARALGESLQAAGEFAHQLEPLGLAAGERGTALAEREVAEAAIAHEPAHLAEPGVKVEKRGRLLERELQHLADGPALPGEVGELRAVTQTAAVVARQVGVGHEGHFEFDAARALAGCAAAARRVEGEAGGGVAADFRLGQRCEKLPDEVEDAEVGGGRGARRLADGRLVDLDDRFENLGAAQGVKYRIVETGNRIVSGKVRQPGELAASEPRLPLTDRTGHGGVQQVAEERGFARARRAADHDEPPERQAQVNALQIPVAHARQLEPGPFPVSGLQFPVGPPHRMRKPFGEEEARQRRRVHFQRRRRVAGDELAAMHAGARTKIDDAVGPFHDGIVVLDDQQGVALVAE